MVSSENLENNISMVVNKQIAEVKRLISIKDYKKSAWLLKELIDKNNTIAEIYFLLGVCLINEEAYLNAASYFSKAIEIEPNLPEYQAMLALAYSHLGNTTLAIQHYENALKLDNRNLSALTGLGKIYYEQDDSILATKYYSQAVDYKPSLSDAQIMLAYSLSDLGEYQQALKHAKKALSQLPNDSNAASMYARVHLVGGNIEEAKKYYKKAIDLDRFNGVAYNGLVSIQKIIDKNDPLIKKMENTLKLGMSVKDRQIMHFALGRAYNDSKQWDKAFDNFEKGNRLIPTSFNQKIEIKFVKKIKKIFSENFLGQFNNIANTSISPIFIIGMPRSGSTLIDQVLSSHTNVFSVGESQALSTVINSIIKDNNTGYPLCVKNITDDIISSFSDMYIELTQKNIGDATHVVDKMLFTYFYLGFVSILFPKAKIIHSIRNPLDTCLSNYFTNFVSNGSDMEWTSSLENIGFSYTKYVEIMKYWKKVLPIQILDIHYEGMVDNFEDNARKIIDFCDLDWQPECLEFYKAKRSVQTASVSQVRQPIYKSAVSRWLPYAKHLVPLVEQLGDIVKDDYDLLKESGCNFKVKKQGLLKRLF